MSKSCIVISIQNAFRVAGLRIKTGGNGKYCVERIFSGGFNESAGPGETLQQAMDVLNAQNSSQRILVDQIRRSSIFEMRMPVLAPEEMRNAIEFELVKHTPLPLSEIVWSARTVPEESLAGSENDAVDHDLARLRIVFMERSGWMKFISELQVRQISLDVYVNPFMCLDPFAAGRDVLLPVVDGEHIFLAGDDGLRHMSCLTGHAESSDLYSELEKHFAWQSSADKTVKDDLSGFVPCMLAARYVLSGEYGVYEKKLAFRLPGNLLPRRNKLLKYFTVANGIAALICLTLLLFQMRQDVYRVYVEQKNAIILKQTQIKNLQVQNAAARKGAKLRQKIIAAVPEEIDPLKVLASMARKLPKYIWLSSYNMTSQKVHLNLTSSRDTGDLLSKLRDERVYTIDNLRKSRRHDGTYYLYLILAPPKNAETGR
ncbi:MAG: hypothetical protein PHV82_05755 [Victivallaceae bacterium]|nr:hypothetical protein [Victivallaceae bacterium]